MVDLNSDVLSRVASVLKGFPYLVFLPPHLQNEETKHFCSSEDWEIDFLLAPKILSYAELSVLKNLYSEYSKEKFLIQYLGDNCWVWVLLNYLYLLSYHPEENADQLFSTLGISVKKEYLFQMAAALSFLSTQSWTGGSNNANHFTLPKSPYYIKDKKLPPLAIFSKTDNPIYQLNYIKKRYNDPAKFITKNYCHLMKFSCACMVATNRFYPEDTWFYLFWVLMCHIQPQENVEVSLKFDLLGFSLSALLDTIPERKVIKDIIHNYFDDLCHYAKHLDEIPKQPLPIAIQNGLNKWNIQYFIKDSHKYLPMVKLFNGKNWNSLFNENIGDFLSFYESVNQCALNYGLFHAVGKYLQGDSTFLQALENFEFPEYIRHIFSYEALLLILTYPDKLGKKMCNRIALKFIPSKRILEIVNYHSFPAFLLMNSNDWATRLYPLIHQQEPVFDNIPLVRQIPFFQYQSHVLLNISSEKPLQWDIEIRKLMVLYRHVLFRKKDNYSLNKQWVSNPNSIKNGSPIWFSLNTHVDNLDKLKGILSAFPLISHEFGNHCFPILKRIYKIKQSNDNEYFFSKGVLKTFYLVNRLVDTKGRGNYPKFNGQKRSFHPITCREPVDNCSGHIAWTALAIRIIWDTLNAPDKQVNLNDYFYTDLMDDDSFKDMPTFLTKTVKFLCELYPIINHKRESILPLIPYMLETTTKDNDLSYIISQSESDFGRTLSPSLGIAKEISHTTIAYISDEQYKNEWERFMAFFALPLYRQYILDSSCSIQ